MLAQEVFPEVAGTCKFTVHHEITLTSGMARRGDIVLFMLDGSMRAGKLLLTVGVHQADHEPILVSRVTVWEYICNDGPRYVRFAVTSTAAKVLTRDLYGTLTYMQ